MYYIYERNTDTILREIEDKIEANSEAWWLEYENENYDLWVVDENEYKARIWDDEIPDEYTEDEEVCCPDDDFGFNPYMGCYDYDC